MVEEGNVGKFQLKWRGHFDLNELVNVVKSWMSNKNYEVHEGQWKTKIKQTGDEVEIDLIGFNKETELVAYRMFVFFHIWDMKKIETLVEGKKKTINSGRLYCLIQPSMILDYSNKYNKTRFRQGLFTFMKKNVINDKLGGIYEDKLFYKGQELLTLIKEKLGTSTQGNEFADVW